MKHSDDLQKDVVGKYVSGISITKLSKETGIPQSTLYGWIKPYSRIQSTAEKTPTMQEYNRLKSHVKKLENMLAILQSVGCTASAPLKDRLETIEALKGQYSVTTLCDALKVAKGTYYNHTIIIFSETRENYLKMHLGEITCVLLLKRYLTTRINYLGQIKSQLL
ncbi:hypothetical protein [Christensenella tenuis]|uniref:hypothetical protein n=1 Tax=Christensenella tenuis TaxID=2763033 RepID=UPI001A9A9048|nr:hypothetical protein [Christensenella tenuis]